jgi:integrase
MENRPKLSESSLKTYTSILVNLHKSTSKDENDSIDWFGKETDEILNELKNKPSNIRKSILSALFVLTNEPKYRELMIDDCKTVNEAYKNQTKSQKERDNWLTMDEISETFQNLEQKVLAMFKNKTLTDTSTIMEYLLVGFLSGAAGIPPRRSLDYALLKIRNFDTKIDNYYRNGKLVFHKYKTSDKYGGVTLDVPKPFDKILKKWIKLNPGEYMLYSSNGNPLSSSQISRYLNKAFGGKSVSTDLLRHIYLTNHYKDVPAIRDMDTLANQMGHSTQQAMLYVKKQ